VVGAARAMTIVRTAERRDLIAILSPAGELRIWSVRTDPTLAFAPVARCPCGPVASDALGTRVSLTHVAGPGWIGVAALVAPAVLSSSSPQPPQAGQSQQPFLAVVPVAAAGAPDGSSPPRPTALIGHSLRLSCPAVWLASVAGGSLIALVLRTSSADPTISATTSVSVPSARPRIVFWSINVCTAPSGRPAVTASPSAITDLLFPMEWESSSLDSSTIHQASTDHFLVGSFSSLAVVSMTDRRGVAQLHALPVPSGSSVVGSFPCSRDHTLVLCTNGLYRVFPTFHPYGAAVTEWQPLLGHPMLTDTINHAAMAGAALMSTHTTGNRAIFAIGTGLPWSAQLVQSWPGTQGVHITSVTLPDSRRHVILVSQGKYGSGSVLALAGKVRCTEIARIGDDYDQLERTWTIRRRRIGGESHDLVVLSFLTSTLLLKPTLASDETGAEDSEQLGLDDVTDTWSWDATLPTLWAGLVGDYVVQATCRRVLLCHGDDPAHTLVWEPNDSQTISLVSGFGSLLTLVLYPPNTLLTLRIGTEESGFASPIAVIGTSVLSYQPSCLHVFQPHWYVVGVCSESSMSPIASLQSVSSLCRWCLVVVLLMRTPSPPTCVVRPFHWSNCMVS
jgi:hypothetical protein